MKTRTAVGIWNLALLVAAAAIVLILRSDHDTNPAPTIALAVPIGLAFVAGGLIAWTQRPGNRTGPLMVATGFTWFIGALSESNHSLPYTLGISLGSVSLGVLIHLLLAFPSGRLGRRRDRLLAGGAYALIVLGIPLAVMFADPIDEGCDRCPANAFLVADSETAARALEIGLIAVAALLLLAILAILALRWRHASPARRRALAPVFLTGGTTLGLLIAANVAYLFSDGAGDAVNWVTLGALLSVPLSFLYGLLRSRLARAGVGRMLAELSETPNPDELRDGLRRALGDPTLELAYRLPESEGWVDRDGRPLELPPEGHGRATTLVEYEGRPLAALLHDASLRSEPELVSEVAAAARIGLEKDRGARELRQSEERAGALLDAIPDLMFRMSRDGTYLAYKAESNRDLFTAPDEIVGRTVYERLPGDVAERIMRCTQEALEHGSVQTLEYDLEIGGELRSYEGRLVVSGDDEVVVIVRNITERKRQDAELRASRARLVEAADAERRRLERNLHDGAQQRLVGLSLTLRLAETRLRADPAGSEHILAEAREELARALNDLRELARGIHPAVLTDRGLEAALEALATRSPVPVEIETPPERLPEAVETAAYYVVSEALANVAKYAQASEATVRIARDNGQVVVEVRDDGIGGADPDAGSGLRGLRDRVSALEGQLEVTSAPGQGTSIRAEIPYVVDSSRS